MKGPDASFQLLAVSYVRKQIKTLLAHIEGIRTGNDTESVHKVRIACRRIRASLNVFKAAFPAKKVRRWNKHIRRLLKELGAARDKDVQIEFVVRMVADLTPEKRAELPGLERLLLRLRQEREAIQPHVIKMLDRLDATGVPSEMLAQTTKSASRLLKARTAIKSQFVIERGARDIQRSCDRLLTLQSCLDDPEAIEQHHQMRIAVKKLRYLMEIYKKVFDKRLNETIKAVHDVQNLFGDIHDCDVWCEFIQTFMQEERQRTIEYYGHARSFRRLLPGFEYLENERVVHRRETFNELVVLWKDLQRRKFWEELLTNLEIPHVVSYSQALDNMTIQAGETTGKLEDTPVSQNYEQTSSIHTRSSYITSPEILEEESTLTSIPVSGPEESQSYTSRNEESKTEIDRTLAPVDEETNRVIEISHDEEPSLTEHSAGKLPTPDRPAISNDSSTKNAICECCGRNNFLQNELFRIDSGQYLCPECLSELHKKAGREAK